MPFLETILYNLRNSAIDTQIDATINTHTPTIAIFKAGIKPIDPARNNTL
jgi:hypothetical protein